MKRRRGGQFWIDSFFPLLVYGSQLWCFEKNSTCLAVNTAWKNVIRKGLGMSTRDSVKGVQHGLWKLVKNPKRE